MKYFLYLFLCIGLSPVALAAPKITVAFNPKDCISCMRALQSFKEAKSNCEVSFILPEQYGIDSAIIVKRYKLVEIGTHVVFSDEQFEQYSRNGISTATIESEYKTGKYSISLINVDASFFSYLARSSKEIDTLFPDQQYLGRGAEKLEFDGSNMLCFSAYKREAAVYDLVNQRKNYSIVLTDSLLKTIYGKSRGSLDDFEGQQKRMIELGVPERFRVDYVGIYKDTVFFQVDCRYFAAGDFDSVLMHSLSITRFYKDKYISTEALDIYEEIDGVLYNNIYGFAHYNNGNFYQSVGPGDLVADRYFLADYEYTSGSLRFHNMYPQKVPTLYGDKLHCSFPVFYKNYVALPLADMLYCLDDTSKSIELAYFPKDNKVTSSRCYYTAYIKSFVVSDDFVWLIQEKEEPAGQYKLEFVKYNRKTLKAEVSPMTMEEKGNSLLAYDPIDPDYLIVQSSKGMLLRRKIF
jgi:hypothetical protein